MKIPQPHRIEAISALADRQLHVLFADGWATAIDLDGFISEHAILQPLLDAARFCAVHVGEWGFDVTWDDGGDLTIAATTLRRLAEAQYGGPRQQFNEWMTRNGLLLSKAADSLGMTRRMIAHYRTGTRPIPKTVLLACKGWEVEQGQ